LLFSNPSHNFINSGQVINHGEEPSPEIQISIIDYHLRFSVNYLIFLDKQGKKIQTIDTVSRTKYMNPKQLQDK